MHSTVSLMITQAPTVSGNPAAHVVGPCGHHNGQSTNIRGDSLYRSALQCIGWGSNEVVHLEYAMVAMESHTQNKSKIRSSCLFVIEGFCFITLLKKKRSLGPKNNLERRV
jgi:hypothetical protein